MFETYGGRQRKTLYGIANRQRRMGAGASHDSGHGGDPYSAEPFPVDKALARDLDRLSFVASRILNTPDIYDVANLATKGECGTYAVFLKNKIIKDIASLDKFGYSAMSPFSAVGQGPTPPTIDVVYQNPLKAIPDSKVRGEICSQISNTMIRAIAIIISCLASIQVASQSREIAMAAVQKGGRVDTSKVVEGLKRLGIVENEPSFTDADDYTFSIKGGQFTLKLQGSDHHHSIPGLLSLIGDTAKNLRIFLLNPIDLPTTKQTYIPMMIQDKDRRCVIAGTLRQGGMFQSFTVGVPPMEFSQLLTIFFTGSFSQERPISLAQSHANFEKLRALQRDSDDSGLIFALSTILQAQKPRPVPGAYGVPQPMDIPGYGYDYGYGRQYPPQLQLQQQQAINPYYNPYALYGKSLQQGTQFDIPTYKIKIAKRLDAFKQIVAKHSSTAAVRATTLAGIMNRNRTVQTNICNDPIWNEKPLHKVFPWATFQFLSVRDWTKFSDENSSAKTNPQFHDEWIQFINELTEVYTRIEDGPKLKRGNANSYFLENMAFDNVKGLKLCESTTAPRVRFKEVSDGLTAIHHAYDEHVKKVWEILNSLIIVIHDPETKTDAVRIHPNVVKTAGGSQKYVEDKATLARGYLKEFYLNIEKSYLNAIKLLQVA